MKPKYDVIERPKILPDESPKTTLLVSSGLILLIIVKAELTAIGCKIAGIILNINPILYSVTNNWIKLHIIVMDNMVNI